MAKSPEPSTQEELDQQLERGARKFFWVMVVAISFAAGLAILLFYLFEKVTSIP